MVNGLTLLIIGLLVCLTVAVAHYARESRRHRTAAVFFLRENRAMKERIHELESDLAIWTDILERDHQAQWNNHPSRRHLRAIDGDA